MAKAPRRSISKEVETRVLTRSKRRCALCFHLDGDLEEKLGQIAHLDGNRANPNEENLAWLCFDHHSLIDSTTSQHKNYTIEEVRAARDRLYQYFENGGVAPSRQAPGAKIIISFHQAHLPAICPPEGHLFTMHLWHNPDAPPMDSLFLGELHCHPGEALQWGSEQANVTAYRCEITNYEAAPILQLRMSFRVEYRRVEKTDSGYRSGELVHHHERPVIIPKVDPGPAGTFFFYVYNDGVSYARVIPRENVRYIHPGEMVASEGKAQIVGIMGVMILPPRSDLLAR